MTRSAATVQHVVRHPLVIRCLVLLVLAAAALAGAAAFIWHPARTQAALAEAERESGAMELRELKYRARLARDFAGRLAGVEALEAKLSQTITEPEFVRDIEALAGQTGVAITQVSPHGTGQSAAAASAGFEFYLNGPYAGLRSFVAELSGLNGFIAVERVTLERDGQSVRAFLVLRRYRKAV
jgi:Tfp pilus assembly protein PilO